MNSFIRGEIMKYTKDVVGNFEIDELKGPNIILLIGVNGSGKTVTSFKMGDLLLKNDCKVKIVNCDVVKHGARYQVEELTRKTGIECKYPENLENLMFFIEGIYEESLREKLGVLIIDTPGIILGNISTLEIIESIRDYFLGRGGYLRTIFIADANLGRNIDFQIRFIERRIKIDGMFISKIEMNNQIGFITEIAKEIDVKIYGIGNGIDVGNIEGVSDISLLKYFFIN